MTFPFSRRLPMLALLGAGTLALCATPSQAYSALYVFGDSLSDAGNVSAATSGAIPASPYVAGRFSNGPVWADTLSAKLNLGPVTPSLLNGNDYAFGYATASNAVPKSDATIPSVPNLKQQVGAYAFTHGSKADASALYAVWIGANDVLNALAGLGTAKLTLNEALTDLTISAQAEAAALKSLVTLGAEHLLVGLVPDIGLTPRVNQMPASAAVATQLSAYYNQQLVMAVKDAAIPKADLSIFDTFTLLDSAVADPSAFGFKNVTAPCYTGDFTGGGTACADAKDYLFWDTVHPTTAGHDIIADLALRSLPGVSSVPLPAGAPLFGAALALLGAFTAFRRRGSHRGA